MMSEEAVERVSASDQGSTTICMLRFIEKIGLVEDYWMVYGPLSDPEIFDQKIAMYVARWTDALYDIEEWDDRRE